MAGFEVGTGSGDSPAGTDGVFVFTGVGDGEACAGAGALTGVC